MHVCVCMYTYENVYEDIYIIYRPVSTLCKAFHPHVFDHLRM